MNRVEIAKRYLEELLGQRQDIVAAWISGSVARGEDTAFSDIDLALMVTGQSDDVTNRDGLDTWREGVYIEASANPQQAYTDLETILNDPYKTTHINDAIILYDPTGFVTQLQAAIRPVFMQPQSLSRRLTFWLENTRTSLAQLQAAVKAADVLEICETFGFFTFGCASIPLLQAGITPSSTRSLLLLSPIDPILTGQLAELEGSTQMSTADLLALEPLLQEMLPFMDASYGQLGVYFIQKTSWMTQQGHHQEALHAIWIFIWAIAQSCRQHPELAVRLAGTALLHRWLHRIHMHEPSIWVVKLQQAEMLLGQLDMLVGESTHR
ncbi:hypothetical protein BH10CHL1_BH10CHL1_14670 [soil metagenome]